MSLFAYAVAPDGGALDAPSPLEGGAVLAGRARAESGAFALTVERLSGAPGQAASRSVRSAVLLPPANTSAPAGGGLGDARFVGARLAPDAAWRVEEVLAGEAAASERAVRLAAFRAQVSTAWGGGALRSLFPRHQARYRRRRSVTLPPARPLLRTAPRRRLPPPSLPRRSARC